MGASKAGCVGGLVAWALVMGGCATGGEPELTTQAYDGPVDPSGEDTATTSGGGATFGPGSNDASDVDPPATTDGPPPDLGMCSDDLDCVLPAGSCLEVIGDCVDGFCMHGAAAPGASCDDGDPCTTADACDGEGSCYGVDVDCGGTGECVDGQCVGGDCPAGMADCNGNAADGCEVPLGTDTDCTGCGDACGGGPNASGSCSAGACQYSCQAPYENCDGDWANGCEVPVGVEHSCSESGIDPNGCWTAYCGNSGSVDATNFGTYYCMDCATCRVPSAGNCQWCNHATGTFFPQDACFCGMYEDLACG